MSQARAYSIATDVERHHGTALPSFFARSFFLYHMVVHEAEGIAVAFALLDRCLERFSSSSMIRSMAGIHGDGQYKNNFIQPHVQY